MRISEGMYLILLVASTLIIYWSFSFAKTYRGYNAVGAEYFTILLPLLIYRLRVKSIEEEKKEE